jgi:heme-degrading monooxygenase HmoA
MFVAINSNIPLKKDSISDFKKWFEESNREISKSDGFVARRLLKSPDGTYTITAEWKSKEQFDKLHSSDTHKRLHEQARSYMEKHEDGPKFYEVVVG